MLHKKSQGHRPSGSGEEDFLRVFTIYGRGGHLGHVTKNVRTNFRSPILRSLHMKYEFNWPCSFRGEDVWKCWRTTDGRRTDGRRTDDGRRSHWYTISSPMILRLTWANKSLSKTSVCKQIHAWHILIFFWTKILVCLLDLILYVPVNTFSVMSGWFFMG